MTAEETLRGMRGVGLTLGVDSSNRLTIRGDRAGYTAALKSAVDMHRSALVEMLTAGYAGYAGSVSVYAGTHEANKISSSGILSASGDREYPAYPAYPAYDTAAPAHTEIASLPVALTRDLPIPTTLVVRRAAALHLSVFTCSAARAESEKRAPRGSQRAVWAIGEAELAAYAVQEGRAFAADFAAWDQRKLASRNGWSLTPQQAIGGAVSLLQGGRPDGWILDGALTLTWGQLLARIGAELIEVVCESLPAGYAGDDSNDEAVML